MAFDRLRDCLRGAEVAKSGPAGTERAYAISALEAYRHMAEGITRRWVGVLLNLAGDEDPPPAIGTLGPAAAARLGALGSRVAAGAAQRRGARRLHIDEDTGLLCTGAATFSPDGILACLTELDVLQRALIVGRLAAFADEPELGGGDSSSRDGLSASSAITFAKQRFGHAGQRIRPFVRDRDRLDVVLDGLRAEACNPCFVALTQTAQVLPTLDPTPLRAGAYPHSMS